MRRRGHGRLLVGQCRGVPAKVDSSTSSGTQAQVECGASHFLSFQVALLDVASYGSDAMN